MKNLEEYQKLQLAGVIKRREALLNRAIALRCAVLQCTPEELGKMAYELYTRHGLPLEVFEDELINKSL